MAEVQIGMGKSARRAYGFDDIAIGALGLAGDPFASPVGGRVSVLRHRSIARVSQWVGIESS